MPIIYSHLPRMSTSGAQIPSLPATPEGESRGEGSRSRAYFTDTTAVAVNPQHSISWMGSPDVRAMSS